MGGVCSTHRREDIYIYTFSMGKPKGRRPLRILRRKWEDNIKLDLKL
jgi:hypothetical protein